MFSVRRVIDNAECHQHRQQDIHQAVNGLGDVDPFELLHAEDHQSCDRKPRGPGLESCKKVFHSFFLLKDVYDNLPDLRSGG